MPSRSTRQRQTNWPPSSRRSMCIGPPFSIPPRTWDIALTKGVLIHIYPDHLATVYNALHQAARRYVCLVEYYNPTPMEATYRGHTGKLFKRDFAGELLDKFPDLRLVDYGFVYRRDLNFPQDDPTWFLLEKSGE